MIAGERVWRAGPWKAVAAATGAALVEVTARFTTFREPGGRLIRAWDNGGEANLVVRDPDDDAWSEIMLPSVPFTDGTPDRMLGPRTMAYRFRARVYDRAIDYGLDLDRAWGQLYPWPCPDDEVVARWFGTARAGQLEVLERGGEGTTAAAAVVARAAEVKAVHAGLILVFGGPIDDGREEARRALLADALNAAAATFKRSKLRG